MPTQTFFNLPAAKRERIIEAAIEEFAEHYFKDASIAGIIAKADIPRGSFYQYFTELEDLYRYIFQITSEKKLKYIMPAVQNAVEDDAFSTIRLLYRKGLAFAREYPRLAQIGNRFFREDAKFRDQILGEYAEEAQKVIVELLRQGQKRGEIDDNVDLDLAVLMILTMNIALIDYMLATNKENDLFADDNYLKLAEKVLYILENGMRTRATNKYGEAKFNV